MNNIVNSNDLDNLIHDESWEVRRAVAKYGRDKDLDITQETGSIERTNAYEQV